MEGSEIMNFMPLRITKSLVPITTFNKGKAGKVFDEVQSEGTKIVTKNNEPSCVLVSPEVFDKMIEEIEDYHLLLDALGRKMRNSEDKLSFNEALTLLGLSPQDGEKI